MDFSSQEARRALSIILAIFVLTFLVIYIIRHEMGQINKKYSNSSQEEEMLRPLSQAEIGEVLTKKDTENDAAGSKALVEEEISSVIDRKESNVSETPMTQDNVENILNAKEK